MIIERTRIISKQKHEYGNSGAVARLPKTGEGLREKWNDYLDRKGIPRKGNGTLNKGE